MATDGHHHDNSLTPLRHVVARLLEPELDIANKDFSGKRVLLRADFNVPVERDTVTDASRITAVLPTIQLLLQAGAKVVLASHFGRPEPKKQSREQMAAQFSLRPVAELLGQELGGAFRGLAPDCIGADTEAAVAALADGQALLLENTRFHAGDTSNSPEFSKALAQLCDVFVNDAFGVSHRDQGSVTGVVPYVAEAYPGPLIRKELQNLGQHLYSPKRPLCCVLGGAKVADKIGVVSALIEMADVVLVGGRMAFTLLASQGVMVGSTQVEEEWLEPCRRMVSRAAAKGVKLLLPHDVVLSSSLDAPVAVATQVLTVDCCTADKPCIPAGMYGVDIGPATCAEFAAQLRRCQTVFWNGPMGKFEIPDFAAGTLAIAQAMDAASGDGSVTIIGGGDSVAAVQQAGLAGRITHISTGGGASLELIEDKGMPGLRALVGRQQQQQQRHD